MTDSVGKSPEDHGLSESRFSSLLTVAATVVGVAVLAVLCAAGVVYNPRVTTAAISVLILVFLTLRFPKATGALIVFVSLFNNVISHYVSSAKLVDDLSIFVFAVLVIAMQWRRSGRLRGLSGGRWFLLFLGAGLAASLARASIVLAAEDAYLFSKGALLAWALAQLDWRLEDVRHVVRFAVFSTLLLLAFLLLNILLPGRWYDVFANHGRAAYRVGGIPSLIGPFIHPGVLGQIMALIASLFFACSLAFRKRLRPLLATALAAAATIFSFRRRALVGLVVGLAAVFLVHTRRRVLAAVVIVVVLAAAVLVAWAPLTRMVRDTYEQYIVQGDSQGRVVLYKASGEIAYHNFPLGVGFARFGGWIASTHYSPVYHQYGVDQVPGMGPGSTWLTDTFWPAVLGQAGVIGLLGYAVFLIQLFRLALRLSKQEDQRLRFLGLLGTAWSIQFFIDSIASAAYNSPPGYLLFFALAGIMSAVSRSVPELAPASVEHRATGRLAAVAVRVRQRVRSKHTEP